MPVPRTSHPGPPPPPTFPRVYRLKRFWWWFLFLFGLSFSVGWFGAIAFLIVTGDLMYEKSPLLMASIFCACGGMGLFALVGLFRYELVLHADGIETFGLIGRRRLRNADIQGRRQSTDNGVTSITLFPHDPRVRKLQIGLTYQTDEVFDAWLASIPDLDAADTARNTQARQESEARFLDDPAGGATVEIRAARLRRARLVAKTLLGLSLVAGAWGLFDPRPYTAAIVTLVAIPPIALVLLALWPRYFLMPGRADNYRAGVMTIFAAPACAIALRMLFDIGLLHWMQGWGLAATAGLGLTMLYGTLCLRSPAPVGGGSQAFMTAMFLVVATFYGYGAIVAGNALLDDLPAQIYERPVLSKRLSTGKQTERYLTLGPWGPYREKREFSVAQDVFDRHGTGDVACVYLRAGRFGIPWYGIDSCRRAP